MQTLALLFLRKTGLLQFGSRDKPDIKDVETALLESGITDFKVYTTTGEMVQNFGKYLKNLEEMSALYDPDAGILLADKCLKALWVIMFVQ